MTIAKAQKDSLRAQVHRSAHEATVPSVGASWLALESRIMFDGAAAATVDHAEQLTQSQTASSVSPGDVTTSVTPPSAPTGEPQFNSNDQALFDALTAYDTSVARQEIVFLSPTVRDYQKLLDGISPNVEVFVLDPSLDGVEQIAYTLANRIGIDAIHVISHGGQGEIDLGAARLTLDSMTGEHANDLAVIARALSENADILIYGCRFGQGDQGAEAAMKLAQLTGADVASSTNDTGHRDLGGDWQLEHRVGSLEAAVAVSDDAINEWNGLLAENILESYEPGFASMGDQAYEVKSDQAWGMTFSYDSPGASYTVSRLGLVLYEDNAASPQVITVSLRSSWNGAVISSGQISSTSLGTTEAWVHIDLDAPATLTDNTTYYIRVDSSLPSGKVYVGVHDAGLYASGDLINDSGAPETPKDMAFRIIETTGNLDPVIVNLIGDNLPYTEGDGAVVIDQGLIVAILDLDSPDFDSGTLAVSFVAGSDAAEDVLGIRNQGAGAGQIGVVGNTVTYSGTAIGSYAGGAGGSNLVVTLNTNATSVATQALLQNITYENTDTDNPTTGARTVRFILSDGDGGSSSNHDTTVTVSGANDPPVNTVPGGQTVNEDTALPISGLSVTDVDGNLSTVQLGVTNGIVTVTLQGAATISAGANGSATLTLSGTQADINSTLATLSYQGTLNYNGSDTLTVTSTDSNSVTDVDTVAITVTAQNDAPVNAVPGGQTVNEDTPLAISGVSVTDVDGNLNTVQLSVLNGIVTVTLQGGASISAGANGSAALRLTGSQADINSTLATLSYQGTLNYNGPDTLTVTGTDALSAADIDTVAITVNPVNDAPVITSDGGGVTAAANVAENQNTATTVTKTDVDGGLPTYSIIGGADAALFTIDATTGVLTFNSVADFEAPVDAGANNVYDVTVQVADGNGGVDVQALSITVIDVVEGLPPSTPPLVIPPSLVSQSPVTPKSNPVPESSSLLTPNVVGSPLSSPMSSETAVVPGPLDLSSITASITSETSVRATGDGKETSASSIAHLSITREDGVNSIIPHAYEQIRKIFSDPTLKEVPAPPLSDVFRKALSLVEEDLRHSTDIFEKNQQFLIRAANIAGVSLTAGVITWVLRAGFLLASLVATMPAWRHFDPLPVVLVSGRKRRKSKTDMTVAADTENKQFRGLKNLFDKKGDDKGFHGGDMTR